MLEVCALLVGVVAGAVTEAPELVGTALDTGPPGVPGAVEAAETEEALLAAELEASSFSAMEKGALVANTMPILETSTN